MTNGGRRLMVTRLFATMRGIAAVSLKGGIGKHACLRVYLPPAHLSAHPTLRNAFTTCSRRRAGRRRAPCAPPTIHCYALHAASSLPYLCRARAERAWCAGDAYCACIFALSLPHVRTFARRARAAPPAARCPQSPTTTPTLPPLPPLPRAYGSGGVCDGSIQWTEKAA